MKQSTIDACVTSVRGRGFWEYVPQICAGEGNSQVIMAQMLRLVEEVGEFSAASTNADSTLLQTVEELADVAVVWSQLAALTGLEGAMIERARNEWAAGAQPPFRGDLAQHVGRLARALRKVSGGDYDESWPPLLALLWVIEDTARHLLTFASESSELYDFDNIVLRKLAADERRGHLHGANGVAVNGHGWTLIPAGVNDAAVQG